MTPVAAIRAAMRRASACAESHPWHTALAALTAGLAAGPRSPTLALLAVAVAICLLGRGRRLSLICAAALVASSLLAGARMASLAPGPAPATELVFAVLLESPRETAFGWRALAQAGPHKLLIRGHGGRPQWATGDEIRAAGRLRPLGERDAWLRPRHVSGVLDARRARLSGKRRGGLPGLVDDVRRRAGRALTERLPPPEAGLLRGMTLGDDAGLPRASLDQLRAAGLGHIVAASGQNIALLAVLVQAIGAVAGIGWRTRLVVTLALIALYVPLAGGGASIQRAGVMGAATVVAALATRPSARWHALLLAAAVTLALDPASLEQPGWQLSFAAVAAIALLSAPLAAGLRRRSTPRVLADAIAMTLAATIGTAPVSAAVFGNVSLAGLAANVIATPVIAPVTWLGMLASAVAQASPAAAAWIAVPAGPPLAFLLGVARGLSRLPLAQVAVPALVACVLSGVAALLIVSPAARSWCGVILRQASRGGVEPPRRSGESVSGAAWWDRPVGRRAALVTLAVLAALVAWPLLERTVGNRDGAVPALGRGSLRVSFLDVGQGDATLLQLGEKSLLVDSGRPGGAALGELRRAGVDALSALVGTHAQSDHVGGADEVLRSLTVGLLIDGRDGVADDEGREMALVARARGVRSMRPRAGDRLRIGDMRVDVLWPQALPDGVVASGDPNDRAVVMLARGAGITVLLTADAESGVLSRLDLPQVDVLKVSHHGSADAGLPQLLERLRPAVAVIEVGAGNTYGHPVPATVAALRASGARVLRTDRDGTVVLEARNGAMTLRTDR